MGPGVPAGQQCGRHRSWPYLSLPCSLITCLPPLQRFRFCGDLDCPDWVLAEISTLAKMSSVKLQLLCSQVVKSTLGGQGNDVISSSPVWPSTVSMADACPVNCSSWGCPKSTRPACAAVMRRSKAPCRSTCGSAAYAVIMTPARVQAHSRRCMQHAKCIESPGR
uniref:COMM domain-containing protein 4 n=1 Tax=Piliocolobus tephrosceles TaxID=591936 RepID=A0A8C9GP34_9PRIM